LRVCEPGAVNVLSYRPLALAALVALSPACSALTDPSNVDSAAVFTGAGDIGWCGSAGPEATARLLDSIGGTVFTTGDNAYPSGTVQDFANCYEPSWGRHRGRTRPTPGNHDYESPGAAPYFSYFGGNAGQSGIGYYGFSLGAWYIIALNSNIPMTAGSPQHDWLRAGLAAHRTTCALAYWHHPLFSSGPHGNNPRSLDVWLALDELGVDVVLNGHDHLYERFAPQTAFGASDPGGIRQFTVGTGGAPLYDFVTARPNSETRLNSSFGVLRLTLREASYDWEHLTTQGSIGDSGTAACSNH
jgi:hypothetical protein